MSKTVIEESKPVFRGNVNSINEIDVDAPIREAVDNVCAYYTQPYGRAAKASEEAGDVESCHVYSFLNVLSSFHPDYVDPASPYRPMWTSNDQRILVPGDLQEDDYPAVRALAEKTADAALRARLYDVLWIGERNHKDCREAIESYVESAHLLDTEENWVRSVTQIGRAVQLASKLGRKSDPFQIASEALVKAIRRDVKNDTTFRTCQLLNVANAYGCGDFAELASIANILGARASEAKEFRKARHYWRVEISFLRRSQQDDKEARVREAETYIQEVEDFEEVGIPSYMQMSSTLKKGIEALRQAGECKERIAGLRRKLTEYQERARRELQTFEHGFDISEEVEASIKHVSGHTLKDALLRFAFGIEIIDVDKLEAELLKLVNEHPLAYMFDGDQMDAQGRTQTRISGLIGMENANKDNNEFEQHMFAHAVQCHWSVRCSAFIDPIRNTINNEHHPSLDELVTLVAHNPFIPPGHENIFLRGIHAGFNEDFLLAAHLLVPQIENSIRYVLESAGVDISNLDSDMTQPVKLLGALFDIPETKEIFGENLCFELRGLLIEKRGYNFRNELAHGFLSEAHCYSDAAVNIWWLTIRTCIWMLLSDTQRSEIEN